MRSFGRNKARPQDFGCGLPLDFVVAHARKAPQPGHLKPNSPRGHGENPCLCSWRRSKACPTGYPGRRKPHPYRRSRRKGDGACPVRTGHYSLSHRPATHAGGSPGRQPCFGENPGPAAGFQINSSSPKARGAHERAERLRNQARVRGSLSEAARKSCQQGV